MSPSRRDAVDAAALEDAAPREDEEASTASPQPELRYLGPVARYLGSGASVVERQLPFAILMTLALLALLSPGLEATSGSAVVLAAAVTVACLVLAAFVPWERLPEWAPEALALLQFVAVAALRQGSGGMTSPFAGMVLLPALALAARAGMVGVLLGTLGAAATVLLGLALSPSTHASQPVVVRSLFVAAIALIIGLVVQESTARLRQRNKVLARLQAEQADALRRTREAAASLGKSVSLRRAAHQQLVSVIDSATEQAIIATDADGMVEVFNAGAERLLGFAQGEVVGRRYLTEFHLLDELLERDPEDGAPPAASDHPTLLRSVLAPRAAAGKDVRDWTYVRRDGSHVTVHPAVTRRTDHDGAVVGYVVVATDVTADREAARLKDQFVGLVSHELRTPLTAVLGYVELLLDETEELTEDQREYLQIIDRNARRQLRLVSDLLLTAQMDAGTFSISPQPVDLATIAAASLATAAPAAAAAGITLESDLAPTSAHADPLRLGQAVDNLVANALKFTDRGGTVRLVVRPQADGGGRLAVSDTGIGIPPDELTHLTERFYRASTATRRAVPGVGLGLAITRAVVEAHGGHVGVTSAVGEGTTFTVTLPPAPSVAGA
jgi:signal transduction histidine kinase